MAEPHPLTILCLAGDVKGHAFIRQCHQMGCRVLLLTRETHGNAGWP